MEKEIIIHNIVCPAAKCTCGKGGGKLLGKVFCTKEDSLVLETVCPNAKGARLCFAFGPTPPKK